MNKLVLSILLSLVTLPAFASRGHRGSKFIDRGMSHEGADILERLWEVPAERYGIISGKEFGRLSLQCEDGPRHIRRANRDLCRIEFNRMERIDSDIDQLHRSRFASRLDLAKFVRRSVRKDIRQRRTRLQDLNCVSRRTVDYWDRHDDWFDHDGWLDYAETSFGNRDICRVEENALVEVLGIMDSAKRAVRRAKRHNPPHVRPRPRPRPTEPIIRRPRPDRRPPVTRPRPDRPRHDRPPRVTRPRPDRPAHSGRRQYRQCLKTKSEAYCNRVYPGQR